MIWTGESLGATLVMFEFSNGILYIGGIPLSHLGFKCIIISFTSF